MTKPLRNLEVIDADLAEARAEYKKAGTRITRLLNERERWLAKHPYTDLAKIMGEAFSGGIAHEQLEAWFKERGITHFSFPLTHSGWRVDEKLKHFYPALRVGLIPGDDCALIAQQIVNVYAEYPSNVRVKEGEEWYVEVFEDGLSEHASYGIYLVDATSARLQVRSYSARDILKGTLEEVLTYVAQHHPYSNR